MNRKLTLQELLWLYSMGGRDKSDVVFINSNPFIHMVGAYRKVYNLPVGNISKLKWLNKYKSVNRTNVPIEVRMAYEHQ